MTQVHDGSGHGGAEPEQADVDAAGAFRAGGGRPASRQRAGRPERADRAGQRQPVRLARRGKIFAWAASVMTAVVVLASLAAYLAYRRLDGNLSVTNVFGGLSNRPPPSARGVLDILILGSQTRDGQGPGFGHDPGTDLSDNLILIHVDATHTHAIVVSIPRDTVVYEPQCAVRGGGGTVPAIPQAIIDGAMNLGGPSCAVATVEHLTGIRTDHFIRFDFNSFRTMVSVLGGVEVCLPQPVHDPFSHLNLAAGKHLVTGNQALAFVRTRHGVGNGGDLGRIQLQQEFMSSLFQKVESQGTLGNPVKLLRIADAATKAVTVDPGLGSISKLVGMAAALRTLHTKNVTFVTMPTVADPANPNRLLPQQPQDDLLWQLLRTGQAWRGGLPTPSASRVKVAVLNGGGVTGLAGQAATGLRTLGFDVISVGNAPAPAAATTVSYPGGAAGGAYAMVRAMKQAPAGEPAVGGGPITLTIGPDFAGVRAPRTTAAPAAGQPGAAAVHTRSAAQNICSGLPSANPNP